MKHFLPVLLCFVGCLCAPASTQNGYKSCRFYIDEFSFGYTRYCTIINDYISCVIQSFHIQNRTAFLPELQRVIDHQKNIKFADYCTFDIDRLIEEAPQNLDNEEAGENDRLNCSETLVRVTRDDMDPGDLCSYKKLFWFCEWHQGQTTLDFSRLFASRGPSDVSSIDGDVTSDADSCNFTESGLVREFQKILPRRAPTTPPPTTVTTPPPTESSPPEYWDVFNTGTADWRLAFRGTPYINQSVYSAFKNPQKTPVEAGCRRVDGRGACRHHYRDNAVFARWTAATEVALVVYRGGGVAAWARFSGATSPAPQPDFRGWFSQRRLTTSSWTDLKTSAYNMFSIRGEFRNPLALRRFYLSRNHGGCTRDAGWLAAIDRSSPTVCAWERNDAFPVFLYSTSDTATRWKGGHVGRADFIAIFVKDKDSTIPPKENGKNNKGHDDRDQGGKGMDTRVEITLIVLTFLVLAIISPAAIFTVVRRRSVRLQQHTTVSSDMGELFRRSANGSVSPGSSVGGSPEGSERGSPGGSGRRLERGVNSSDSDSVGSDTCIATISR